MSVSVCCLYQNGIIRTGEDGLAAMFARIITMMRFIGSAALATLAAVCVLAISGLALVVTMFLAPPRKRLRNS